MRDAFICDIDGTIAHHDGKRDVYDASRAHLDRVDPGVSTIVHNVMKDEVRAIFITGRNESTRKATENWLWEHLDVTPGGQLLMRRKSDRRPDFVMKRELYEESVAPFFNVLFVLEDRDQVVKMWRGLGLKCLQVQEGNY